jgi:hypothetical protein
MHFPEEKKPNPIDPKVAIKPLIPNTTVSIKALEEARGQSSIGELVGAGS